MSQSSVPLARVNDFEQQYPKIKWRHPMLSDECYFGCRICIALYGLTGTQPQSYEEWRLHFLRHLDPTRQ
jgi:hypothetical protein